MIVYNPTQHTLAVNIKGVDYRIGPKEELAGVPEVHAEHWKVHIHHFVEVKPEKEDKEITTKSAVGAVAQPRDIPKEEPKVEEPKAAAPVEEKKTTNKTK